MKIPFFEILALLFLLWPLIQRYMKKNQPIAEEPVIYEGENYPDDDQFVRNSEEVPENSDWDHAMRELEMIFTGKTPPEPKPAEFKSTPRHNQRDQIVSGARPEVDQRSFYAQRLKKNTQQDSEFKSDDLVDILTASDNVIYKSLDEAVEIDDSDKPVYSIFQDVGDVAKLRDFIIMKEVLDKPRSRRPIGRNSI
jgi:hypothetical protein